jgi:exosortase K
VRLNRWQVAGCIATLVVVYAGKRLYSAATPGELAWVLGPVSKLVGLVTGVRFEYDTSQGWVSQEARFVIAPVCAGINFALATFTVLSLAWLPVMQRAAAVARRLLAAAALAYLATIVADTLRIALSMWTHARGDAHQALGIVVYLAALCSIYALASRGGSIARRNLDHAVVR